MKARALLPSLLAIAIASTAMATPRRISLVEGLKPFRDLASYFRSTRLRRSLRHLARGSCRPPYRAFSRALKRRQLPEDLRGPAAFVAGYCARELGRHGEAADYLAESLSSYAGMRDWAQYLLAESLLRAKEYHRASQAAARVPKSSPRFHDAMLVFARALKRSSGARSIVDTLAQYQADHPLDPDGMPALPQPPRPPRTQTGKLKRLPRGGQHGRKELARRAEIGFVLADALERSGAIDHAISQYLYVWARFPHTVHAKSAEKRLKGHRRRGRQRANPDVYHRLLRGRSLLAVGLAKKARKMFSSLLRTIRKQGPASLRWEVELGLAVALSRSGARPAADRRFKQIGRRADEAEIRAEALYRRAALLARRRRVATALAVYAKVAKLHPHSQVAAKALFDGANFARLYSRHEHARTLYDRLASNYPRFEESAAVHWRLGWYAYKVAKMEEAREHFSEAVALAPMGKEEERALYWLGRAQAHLGRHGHAAAAFKLLGATYSLSYYAYLAKTRLLDLPASDSRVEEANLRTMVGGPTGHEPSEFTHPRLIQARELARLGMKHLARQVLRTYERGGQATAGGMVTVATLYDEIGNNRKAHWTLRLRAHAFRRSLKDRGLIDYWFLAYPRRFIRAIERAAQRAGLPAGLLFGLIREESSFHPRAVSTQKAVGLTQVIWATAKDMARELRLRVRSRKDLYRPGVNAMLGARFLSKLTRYYRGHRLMAVAAYNAGPGNVDRWLKARGFRRTGPIPEDEIVEEIPFAETKAYVRKVLSSYAAYSYLYYGERVAWADPIRIGVTLASNMR